MPNVEFVIETLHVGVHHCIVLESLFKSEKCNYDSEESTCNLCELEMPSKIAFSFSKFEMPDV